MKIYRRYLEITPQQEMHLQVDHYLEEYTPSEEEILNELQRKMVYVIETNSQESYYRTRMFTLKDLAKAIIRLYEKD